MVKKWAQFSISVSVKIRHLGLSTDCNKLQLQITLSHENIFVFYNRIIIYRNIFLSRRKTHEVTLIISLFPFLCLQELGTHSSILVAVSHSGSKTLVFRALVLQIVNLILYFSQQSIFILPLSRRILLIQELKFKTKANKQTKTPQPPP